MQADCGGGAAQPTASPARQPDRPDLPRELSAWLIAARISKVFRWILTPSIGKV